MMESGDEVTPTYSATKVRMRPTVICTVARRSRSLVECVTLTLDERPPEVVDLQATVVLNIYESEASAARWGATGLDNVSHSLVVTYGEPLNNTPGPAPYTIVDGLIYTVEDETSTTGTYGNASKSPSTPLTAGLVGGLGPPV